MKKKVQSRNIKKWLEIYSRNCTINHQKNRKKGDNAMPLSFHV